MAGNARVGGESVISKVAAILRCFNDRTPRTLSEIAATTALPLSTVYRLLNDLVSSGIMTRTERTRYRMDYCITDARHDPSVSNPTMLDCALPVLDDLVAVAHRSIRVGVLRELSVSFIERAADRVTVTAFGQNAALPLHATAMGKILLAFSPPSLLTGAIARGLAAYTPRTITDIQHLRGELSEIRRTSIAANWGEFDPRSSEMAVPVFGARGELVGTLGLPVRGRADLDALYHATVFAARTLSRRLVEAAVRPPGAIVAPHATPLRERAPRPA